MRLSANDLQAISQYNPEMGNYLEVTDSGLRTTPLSLWGRLIRWLGLGDSSNEAIAIYLNSCTERVSSSAKTAGDWKFSLDKGVDPKIATTGLRILQEDLAQSSKIVVQALSNILAEEALQPIKEKPIPATLAPAPEPKELTRESSKEGPPPEQTGGPATRTQEEATRRYTLEPYDDDV